MSTAQMVLEYINGLKWPVFAGGIIYYFREPLTALGDRITNSERGSFSGFGVSFSWEGGLKQAEKDVKHAREGLQQRSGSLGPLESRPDEAWAQIRVLASAHPTAAVLLAWREVELSLKRRAVRVGLDPITRIAGRRLVQAAKLPRDLENSLRPLEELRNAAAHTDDEPTSDQAERYANIAQDLARTIEFVPDLA